jgi:uncharacterized membrane protein HdeD (DUF308 family)
VQPQQLEGGAHFVFSERFEIDGDQGIVSALALKLEEVRIIKREQPMDTKTTSADPRYSTQDSAQVEAMSAVLAENWWAMALRGVVGILFGIVAFLLPAATILSVVLVFSAYMLVDGLFAIVAGIRAARRHERWGLLILEGVVNIAAAVVAVFLPGITVLAFVLLMAAWALLSGGLMLGSAFKLKQDHGRWWLALSGVASIIFGVLLVIAPLVGALVLTWWVGAYALVFGAALLVLAFKLRMKKAEHPTLAQHA